MSQYILANQNFFDESYDKYMCVPSHMFGEKEINDQLFNYEVPIEQDSTEKQTKKREHTTHKVLLSVIHKILFWSQDTTSKFQDLLKDVNMRHNNSTLSKFIILAKKANLISVLQNEFRSKAEERLEQLKSKNSWTEKRSKNANEWKLRFEKALSCRNFQKIINIVWQGGRHQTKLNHSIKTANDFQRMMKRYKKSHLRKAA